MDDLASVSLSRVVVSLPAMPLVAHLCEGAGPAALRRERPRALQVAEAGLRAQADSARIPISFLSDISDRKRQNFKIKALPEIA